MLASHSTIRSAKDMFAVLLYGLCMRLACLQCVRRVHNDNFSSIIVQRLNAKEGNNTSLCVGGRLGKA
jgi:hypothetical protein